MSKKTSVAVPCGCYMCDNARINKGLTDDNDLSYIGIGNSDESYRIMFRSGSGRPPAIQIENFIDGEWRVIAFYNPNYCPNCGRKIYEYLGFEIKLGAELF